MQGPPTPTSNRKYATDVWLLSFLYWYDKPYQDPAAVNLFRDMMVSKALEERRSHQLVPVETIAPWTIFWTTTDKCAGQYASRKGVRSSHDWLQGQKFGFEVFIKNFHCTSHGGCIADTEGGGDKRSVSSYIRDEKNFKAKLPVPFCLIFRATLELFINAGAPQFE